MSAFADPDPFNLRNGEPWPMGDEFMRRCTNSAWSGDEHSCRWCDKKLRGRQRRWCSTRCSNEAGWHHWWSAASRVARGKTRACERCSGTVELQAHHIERALGRHGKASCIHHPENIEVLCSACHKKEHGAGQGKPRERKRVPGFEHAQLNLRVYNRDELAQPRG